MFLGLLGAGLMWMPASAILAAQMNNAAMSVQQNQGIKVQWWMPLAKP